MNPNIYTWNPTLPFKGMRHCLFGSAKVCYQVKTKRQRLILMIHGGPCRKAFVFVCVDRRFPNRQQRAVDRGHFWKVCGGVNAQVKNLRSYKQFT